MLNGTKFNTRPVNACSKHVLGNVITKHVIVFSKCSRNVLYTGNIGGQKIKRFYSKSGFKKYWRNFNLVANPRVTHARCIKINVGVCFFLVIPISIAKWPNSLFIQYLVNVFGKCIWYFLLRFSRTRLLSMFAKRVSKTTRNMYRSHSLNTFTFD